MADNYQNYIYLFNDEQMLKQDGSIVPDSFDLEKLTDWTVANAEDNQYSISLEGLTKALGSTYDMAYKTAPSTDTELEDFPTAETAESPLVSTWKDPDIGVATSANTGDVGDGVITLTEDPGHNVWNTHVFKVMPPSAPDFIPTKEYKFGKIVNKPGVLNFSEWSSFKFPTTITDWKPTQFEWLTLRNYRSAGVTGFAIGSDNNLGKPNAERPLIPNKKNPQFLFHQDATRRIFEWKHFQGDRAEFAMKMEKLFWNYYYYTSRPLPDPNGYFVSNSIYDINTKIGTPYDFQTLLLEGMNDSANGVDSKQPSYDKLYNYHDDQYEPIIISAIENNIMDEKGLPSIYDFLYLDQQKELRPYIKINGMSLEESNLASINQWLDNYAKEYATYMSKQSPSIPLENVVPKLLTEAEKLGVYTEAALGIVPTPPDLDSRALLKYTPTFKKWALLSTRYLTPPAIDTLKAVGVPTWLSELKTGIYFSEKQLDTFTETLDKDTVFPHVLKVNIPIETVGPIAKLLSEYNLLDSLNSYAASTTISGSNTSAYQTFSGCVINGIDNKNFNNLNDLKLPSFKIRFNKKDKLYTYEELLSAGTRLNDKEGYNSLDTSTYLNFEPSDNDIFYSWLNGRLNVLLKSTFKDKADYNFPVKGLQKTFFKVIPISVDDPDLPGGFEHDDVPYPATVQMWSYCIDDGPSADATKPGCLRGFRSPPHAHTDAGLQPDNEIAGSPWELKYTSETHALEKARIINNLNDMAEETHLPKTGDAEPSDLTPAQIWESMHRLHIFGALPGNIYDLSDTDITPFSIFSEKTGISDLHIDNLTAGIVPEVLVYGVNKNVTSNDGIQALLEKLKAISLKKKLSKLFVDSKLMRTPNDIHNGKLAHQETLMYEIAKYSISDGNKEKYIQSIFLPITEKSQLSYYDTQVLPFKDYFYKIFAHKAIVGTKYKAIPYNHINNSLGKKTFAIKAFPPPANYNNNVGGDDPKTNLAEFFIGINYEIEPYIEVVRTPYYNVSAVNIAVDKLNYSRIEDYPPLAPQVNFVPFKGVNNKVLIMLNNSIGQIEQYPRVLYEYEKKLVSDLALAQDRIPGDKLIYKSDDAQGTFSCFRVNNLFRSYETLSKDKSMRLRELESNSIEKNDSYIDYIMPNQTYYYVFRFTDIHNKMSNPTDIYKVRMEQPTVGSSYLTVDILDIKDIQKKNHDSKFSTVREMQKYLYIQPNFSQNTVTAEPDIEKKFFKEASVSLGDPAGDSVFGKKFKIRISSKQTGKKIDINLTVKDPEIIINE